MKSTVHLRQGLLVLSLGLAALPAAATDDCEAPLNRWQSRDAVRQMAAAQGWQIQRLKIDDGCYELRGTDAQGREFKAKLDPQTLRVVKMKRRERERDHERDREREREHDRDRDRDRDRQRSGQPAPGEGAPPQGAATAPATPAATPHLTPGTTPRGQIE